MFLLVHRLQLLTIIILVKKDMKKIFIKGPIIEDNVAKEAGANILPVCTNW